MITKINFLVLLLCISMNVVSCSGSSSDEAKTNSDGVEEIIIKKQQKFTPQKKENISVVPMKMGVDNDLPSYGEDTSSTDIEIESRSFPLSSVPENINVMTEEQDTGRAIGFKIS